MAVAGPPEQRVTNPAGKPMHEWKECVGIQREAAVGRCDEDRAARSEHFRDESPLVAATSDVLDHGISEANLERVCVEGEGSTIGNDKPHLREDARESWHVLQRNGGDARGPGVLGLEEIAGAPGGVGNTDIENTIRCLWLDDLKEAPHSPFA